MNSSGLTWCANPQPLLRTCDPFPWQYLGLLEVRAAQGLCLGAEWCDHSTWPCDVLPGANPIIFKVFVNFSTVSFFFFSLTLRGSNIPLAISTYQSGKKTEMICCFHSIGVASFFLTDPSLIRAELVLSPLTGMSWPPTMLNNSLWHLGTLKS